MSAHNATPHRFTRTRRIPWDVCTSCGLVRRVNYIGSPLRLTTAALREIVRLLDGGEVRGG